MIGYFSPDLTDTVLVKDHALDFRFIVQYCSLCSTLNLHLSDNKMGARKFHCSRDSSENRCQILIRSEPEKFDPELLGKHQIFDHEYSTELGHRMNFMEFNYGWDNGKKGCSSGVGVISGDIMIWSVGRITTWGRRRIYGC